LDDAYYASSQIDHKSFSMAIDGTHGAKRGDLWTEAHAELSSLDEYLLEITPSNIAALWKTGFQWDSEAMRHALDAVMPIVVRSLQ
jgi:hypothetical protein